MKFITYGIHTRLHYLIKRVGGINKVARRDYLKTTYGFDDETVDIVLMYNIEKLLKDTTIEEVKILIKEKKSKDRAESERALKTINSLMTTLCMNTNMYNMKDSYKKYLDNL